MIGAVMWAVKPRRACLLLPSTRPASLLFKGKVRCSRVRTKTNAPGGITTMPSAFAGNGSVKPMISARSMLSKSMECAVPFAWSASLPDQKVIAHSQVKRGRVKLAWVGRGINHHTAIPDGLFDLTIAIDHGALR